MNNEKDFSTTDLPAGRHEEISEELAPILENEETPDEKFPIPAKPPRNSLSGQRQLSEIEQVEEIDTKLRMQGQTTIRREIGRLKENLTLLLLYQIVFCSLLLAFVFGEVVNNPLNFKEYVKFVGVFFASVIAVVSSYQYSKKHPESARQDKQDFRDTIFTQK